MTTVAAIPLLTEVRRFLAAFYAFYLIEFKDDAALFPASWIDGQIVSSQAAFSVRLVSTLGNMSKEVVAKYILNQ
ncbi:hypothetical protein, partial [Mitsuokella multacida]|uniref:hypothetical protein n=1 Tax=Mitsuokella multacida TaxID=52226 RepID=UPI003FEF503A